MVNHGTELLEEGGEGVGRVRVEFCELQVASCYGQNFCGQNFCKKLFLKNQYQKYIKLEVKKGISEHSSQSHPYLTHSGRVSPFPVIFMKMQ